MLLVELATQGVRGFSPSSRSALAAGYNVALPPPGAPPGVVPLLLAILFGEAGSAELELATGEAPARAGLTINGLDGRTYRLVRSLGGGGAVTRQEPDNTWTPVAPDPSQIAQVLRAALGLPKRAVFEELLCFSAAQLPSQRLGGGRPAQGPRGAARPAAAGKLAPEPVRVIRPNALVESAMAASRTPRIDPEQARRDLDRLGTELKQAREVEELQFQLEGLHRQTFELSSTTKKWEERAAVVQKAKASLDTSPSLATLGLPRDGLDRAQRYDAAKKKLDENLKKVREEDFALQEHAPSSPLGLWLDRRFQVAAGGGMLALVAGILLRDTGGRYLALVDVPAFGFAAFCALQWIGELQRHEAYGRKLAVWSEREAKVRGAFDAEYGVVKNALDQLDVVKGASLVEILQRRAEEEAKVHKAQVALDAEGDGSEARGASEELARVSAEAKELEERISAMGAGMTRGPREIEKEIQDLEASLAAGSESVSTPAAVAGAGEAGESAEDPIPALLLVGRELFAAPSVEAVAGLVRDRAGQYLLALSDRRYLGVHLDANGNAGVLMPGRTVPAGQLDSRDRDLLYLAVKLTLVEKHAPRGKLTIVLDDPFAGFDEGRLVLLSRMLKHIASSTQVVHATGLAAHRPFADATPAL